MTADTRFELTADGASALALDDELQARLDAAALDQIARTLGDDLPGPVMLDLIGTFVRETRRSIPGVKGRRG